MEQSSPILTQQASSWSFPSSLRPPAASALFPQRIANVDNHFSWPQDGAHHRVGALPGQCIFLYPLKKKAVRILARQQGQKQREPHRLTRRHDSLAALLVALATRCARPSMTEVRSSLLLLARPSIHHQPIFSDHHARKGLHVIATARNPAVLAEFADAPGFTCLQLDVTDEASIAACRDQVAELTGGRLDILVNNACVGGAFPRPAKSPTRNADLDK